jgi:RNA polymerase sigma factor (TIGR02999 family)
MPADAPNEVSLAARAARGDREAAAELLPLIYDDLRNLARARMARLAPGQTLQPTALVHEAYARVIGKGDPGWDGRGHFFAAAAQAMRNILVDQARRKAALKRGGGRRRRELADDDLTIQPPREDVLALDEALSRLEAEDPRKGQIVNLRYFAGLTADETAAVMDVSKGTIEREWRYIKAWLQMQLAEDSERAAERAPDGGEDER